MNLLSFASKESFAEHSAEKTAHKSSSVYVACVGFYLVYSILHQKMKISKFDRMFREFVVCSSSAAEKEIKNLIDFMSLKGPKNGQCIKSVFGCTFW